MEEPVSPMAMTEVDMAEYVKREELAAYVLRTEINDEMTSVAQAKVIAAIGTKENKDQVTQLIQGMFTDESKALIKEISQAAIQH